jgi:hypothetical protein
MLPIKIKLPVRNKLYADMDTEALKEKVLCTFQQEVSEAW